MKKFLLVCLLFATNAFSQKMNDSAEIVKLLSNDYKTMSNWDIKSYVKNCTENYLLIENGEVWDMKIETEYYIKM